MRKIHEHKLLDAEEEQEDEDNTMEGELYGGIDCHHDAYYAIHQSNLRGKGPFTGPRPPSRPFQPSKTGFQPKGPETQRKIKLPRDLWELLSKEGNAQDVIVAYNCKLPSSSQRSVNFQELTWDEPGEQEDSAEPSVEEINQTPPSEPLLAHLTNQKKLDPTGIRQVLSLHHARQDPKKASSNATPEAIEVQGKKYKLEVNILRYTFHNAQQETQQWSLVDRGANGGMAGEDLCD